MKQSHSLCTRKKKANLKEWLVALKRKNVYCLFPCLDSDYGQLTLGFFPWLAHSSLLTGNPVECTTRLQVKGKGHQATDRIANLRLLGFWPSESSYLQRCEVNDATASGIQYQREASNKKKSYLKTIGRHPNKEVRHGHVYKSCRWLGASQTSTNHYVKSKYRHLQAGAREGISIKVWWWC